MIDTHCHLYLSEFKSDLELVIESAESAGVKKFYLPAIDQSSYADLLALEDKFPGKCSAMMGLHPCSVNEDVKDQLQLVGEWLSKRKFAAIGETGLDFYWDKSFKLQQYEALHKQVEFALQYSIPIVLHTRDAMQETIDVIEQYRGTGLKGIFHCFGGSIDQAFQISELEFLMGIGGVITYKNSGLQQVLAEMDLKQIVLETDAPYLAPVPYRGKRNESRYLPLIAEKISEIKQVPISTVVEQTTKNAESIFPGR